MTVHRNLNQEALATTERLQALLNGSERAMHVPIAILSAGCGYAGGVDSPGKVWDLSWLARRITQFDATFSGISPPETATGDPLQRPLLEAATEALERAGIATDVLQGSVADAVGFTATSDYGHTMRRAVAAPTTH